MAKKSEEAKKALEMLGHDPDKAEGGDLDDFEDDPGSDQEEPEESPGSDPAPVEEEVQTGSDQLAVEQEEEPKNWQSWYDKAKSDLDVEKKRAESLEKQNQAMLAMLSGQQQQPKQEQPKAEKRPELSDFIKMGDYDTIDALNPATASGQAREKYEDAIAEWRTRQAYRQEQQRDQEQKRSQIAQTQAAKLAEQYEEFRDAFGMPDMKKISQFMDSLANEEDPDFWAKLYQLKKQPAQARQDVSQIGRNADKSPRVAGRPAAEESPKKPPKVFQDMAKTFGDFEYPSGAEFE